MSLCSYNCNFNFPLNNTSSFIPPIPNYALEEQALVSGLRGGYYDYQLQEVVPNDPSFISKIFNCTKNYFSRKIGNIYGSWEELGLNTATNHKNLRKDAKAIAPKFIENLRKISKATGGDANFGPGDMFALKSEGSLKRKIASDSRAEKISMAQATQKISDAVRGTIIVDSEEQIQSITKKTNEWIEREGGEISWKNIFQEERDDGYVGIHGKVLLPFTTYKGEKRRIRCELQLHFRTIADGSLDSPKERMHLLYKDPAETLASNRSFVSRAISKLSFLSGMASIGNICRIPEYLIGLCPKIPSLSKNLCDDSESASLCEGNLGIPRHQMPQVSGSIKRDFLKKKESQGVKVEKRSIPATQLTPVQNELSRTKVAELVDSFGRRSINPCEKAILVSSQNENDRQYVIDGHHRYAACRLVGGDQEVIAIHDNVENLLSELETFPGVRRSGLENLEVRAQT